MNVLVPETHHPVSLYAMMAASGVAVGWLAYKSTTSAVVGGGLGVLGVYLYEKYQEHQAQIASQRAQALEDQRAAALRAVSEEPWSQSSLSE